MFKNFVLILIGIIALSLIGVVFLFKGAQRDKEYIPLEGSITPENILKIKGVGFKREAWSEYKIEGYGVKIEGGTTTQKIGKLLVKLISLSIQGEEHIGIELDGKEESGIESFTFALLLHPEKNETIYLMKIKGAPIVCSKQLPATISGLPYEEFSRKNLENEYSVDTSEWNFVSKENITLESGKRIEVYKFRRETIFEGNKIINELWLSGEVPTYLVMNSETIDKTKRSITLTNFGMDGGLPNFTKDDLKACESEIPGLPSELQKMACNSDEDCACGVDKQTGKCAYGNKIFIDTSKQCPDFCTGIAGNLRIKCVNNVCMLVPV